MIPELIKAVKGFFVEPKARPAALPDIHAETPSGNTAGLGYFEATRNSPDRTPISTVSFSLARMYGRSITEAMQRETLAGLARYVADNYPSAWLALDYIANYSTPVIPKGATADAVWNKEAEAYFDQWAEQADFTRGFDFETLQRAACLAIDIDGDGGFTMETKHGRPELRWWPTWRVGGGYAGLITTQDPTEFDGVFVDADGAVRAYRLLAGNNRYVTRAREQFIHLYEPDLLERYRGFSALRRGMNDLRDAHDIKAFEKLASKIESAMPAVIEGQGVLASDWEDPESDVPSPSTGTAPKSLTVAQLLGGEIPVISGTLKQLAGARQAASKLEFMDSLAGFFVAGLGIPPAFFLDAKLTGPNLRAVIGKAQRKFDSRKKTMRRLARWSWQRVIAWGIDTGELRSATGWQRCRFQEPSLITIDLGDQANADREAVSMGLKSRQRFHGDSGADWQDEVDQVFAEDDYIFKRAKAQADASGVPLETILMRHGYEPPVQKPEANPGGEPTAPKPAARRRKEAAA